MAKRKIGDRCIGHRANDGDCQNWITAESLKLNRPGLWCVECETARRDYLDKQFERISQSFEEGK